MASNEIEILDAEPPVGKLKKIAAGRALNRRHFLAALGMTGAAAGAGMLSGCSTSSSVTPATTTATSGQTAVLNFLLNVKYLQATYYSFITQGSDLTGAAVTGSGAITGAPAAKLTFTGTNATQITDMLNEIYFDEKNHVSTLMSLLGASAVFRPALNLAAFGTITATNAVAIARVLEDVAVTAYTGAVTGLSSSDVTVTSQVFGVDGFHAGALRLISVENSIADISGGPLDVPPADPGTGVATTGPTAAGGFFATAGSLMASTTDPAGFAFVRTTSQVLAVLFGSPGTPAASGTTSGGFYPSGVNGSIRQV